jgi:hypothetical protein
MSGLFLVLYNYFKINNYIKDSRIIYVLECNKPYKLENIIKNEFIKHFTLFTENDNDIQNKFLQLYCEYKNNN